MSVALKCPNMKNICSDWTDKCFFFFFFWKKQNQTSQKNKSWGQHMDMLNWLKYFFFWLVAPSVAWWCPVAEPRPTVFKMTGGAQWRPVAPLVLVDEGLFMVWSTPSYTPWGICVLRWFLVATRSDQGRPDPAISMMTAGACLLACLGPSGCFRWPTYLKTCAPPPRVSKKEKCTRVAILTLKVPSPPDGTPPPIYLVLSFQFSPPCELKLWVVLVVGNTLGGVNSTLHFSAFSVFFFFF